MNSDPNLFAHKLSNRVLSRLETLLKNNTIYLTIFCQEDEISFDEWYSLYVSDIPYNDKEYRTHFFDNFDHVFGFSRSKNGETFERLQKEATSLAAMLLVQGYNVFVGHCSFSADAARKLNGATVPIYETYEDYLDKWMGTRDDS